MPSADRTICEAPRIFPTGPKNERFPGFPLRDGVPTHFRPADVSGNIFPFRPPLSAANGHTLGSPRVGTAEQPHPDDKGCISSRPFRQALRDDSLFLPPERSEHASRGRERRKKTRRSPPKQSAQRPPIFTKACRPPCTIFRRSAPKPHCPKRPESGCSGNEFSFSRLHIRPANYSFFWAEVLKVPRNLLTFVRLFPYTARTLPKVPERG